MLVARPKKVKTMCAAVPHRTLMISRKLDTTFSHRDQSSQAVYCRLTCGSMEHSS